jgi:uncharacterized SAM-binding protein YcdF (DUF218 family)
MFPLKKLLSSLMLPPTSLLLLAMLGLWLARRRPRLGHALVAGALATLWLLSTPRVAGKLIGTLEDAPPIESADLRRCQAIVILGAGSYANAPEYGGDTVNELALERLRLGARLARASGLPIAVTGGAPSGGRPEGESMREALTADFGVKVRWVESQSRDTAENAAYLAPMLARDGIIRIALVTHAFHMPRARALFEQAGLQVVPAPTRYFSAAAEGGPLGMFGDWLPGLKALRLSHFAAHEWLGRGAGIIRLSIDRHLHLLSS